MLGDWGFGGCVFHERISREVWRTIAYEWEKWHHFMGIVGPFLRMRQGVVMETHSWLILLDAQCIMRFRGEQLDNASFQTTSLLVICLYISIIGISTIICITIICTCITFGIG